MPNIAWSHKISILDNSSKKTNLKKNLFNFELCAVSDTTQFSYDEYIDQPKLSEQKNPFEYVVPPPTSGVGTIMKSELLSSGGNQKLIGIVGSEQLSNMLNLFARRGKTVLTISFAQVKMKHLSPVTISTIFLKLRLKSENHHFVMKIPPIKTNQSTITLQCKTYTLEISIDYVNRQDLNLQISFSFLSFSD